MGIKIEPFKTISMKAFIAKFNDNYEFIYNANDNVAGYREALEYGDTYLSDEKNFDIISAFNNARHDFISSDREIVAFMFTLEDFGLLD